ncbi:aspartyl/glutamyl-tRNA(Asn/Gln) amidotransferase subunit A [Roseivirga ehrenbergii]|uniref:Glutamyl-tRNA(Gln) amidotransferase subunit A n=1 Tax=Roseivirga ehrenbergii (strain DSM 102268 / JCM 13514 / KCTC 12282 / NCIMB 14502 / KMM 6017) TaxID=279360 RepID=A0A150XT96_ROSEK|nr:Asp-tRNA(Asn)/Glu-tRNA(Gln) amidotransferase subunit GatA [Roseivirga ehrenbergii]KYG81842.1 aspartyl/glutamyl-tRNA amidotransferase subunit A [Roseivirga ehrenbergii]TCL01651.1 aspartyl/glutamyl-tRNA(Asn/Gln) amidotransferase subunit A [Roseivirga ehrenbergii]
MKSYHTLDEIQRDIRLEVTSCRALVEHYLHNIKSHSELNAFVEVYSAEALQKADIIDRKIKENKAGKLAGLIFGIKDLICYQDHKVSGASKILQNFESQFSATAVEKLLQEDAILIGRQNCDEFGMGSSNENSFYGPVKNALDHNKVAGGSSGGSAVAVQADMCQISLGTDTGGSVRQPAAFCGIVGLKPTYSRISRWGLLAYASSFDSIGIFSKSIEDNARVLEIIAGKDEKDSTSSSRAVPAYSQNLEQKNTYKVAYLQEALDTEALQPEIKAAFQNQITELQEAGHTVEAVNFPLLDYILPTYYILTTAEVSSNLSRYDGIRYGHRSSEVSDLESLYKNSRTEGFGAEARRRIMLGSFVLSADYYDAYFTKAQKARKLIKEATEKILSEYDFIIIPTTPTTAFDLGEHSKSPIEVYMADLFTVQASISGLPAISVPVGKDDNGMPIGLQIISAAFQEAKLFAFSRNLIQNI